jgi:hypothetical protein
MTTPNFSDRNNAVLRGKPETALIKLRFSTTGLVDYTLGIGNSGWTLTEAYDTLFSDKYLLCCASALLRDVLGISDSDSDSEHVQTMQTLELEDPPNAWWEVLRILHPLDHTTRHLVVAEPTDWTWVSQLHN